MRETGCCLTPSVIAITLGMALDLSPLPLSTSLSTPLSLSVRFLLATTRIKIALTLQGTPEYIARYTRPSDVPAERILDVIAR